MTGGSINEAISSCALSSRTDRRKTEPYGSKSNEFYLRDKNDLLSTNRQASIVIPMSVRNQNENYRSMAVTSGVSLTESKLIIALRKDLTQARDLLEREHAIKMKLIEGARDLKHQLQMALHEKQSLKD